MKARNLKVVWSKKGLLDNVTMRFRYVISSCVKIRKRLDCVLDEVAIPLLMLAQSKATHTKNRCFKSLIRYFSKCHNNNILLLFFIFFSNLCPNDTS